MIDPNTDIRKRTEEMLTSALEGMQTIYKELGDHGFDSPELRSTVGRLAKELTPEQLSIAVDQIIKSRESSQKPEQLKATIVKLMELTQKENQFIAPGASQVVVEKKPTVKETLLDLAKLAEQVGDLELQVRLLTLADQPMYQPTRSRSGDVTVTPTVPTQEEEKQS